ncbi:MAG: bile acid:sodium symporter family protein [Cellvibrionales bacterium]|nr:bile acid:sodium symporter family protein [Cellvibrionales bacterium]
MTEPTSSLAVAYFLPFSLAMMTLAMGLGLTIDDFKALYQKPKATIVGLLGQLLVLPALAFAIAYSLKLPTEFAIGLVLLASCPGGAHSNLLSHFARGDVALSIALTAITGILCVLSIPFYVGLATQVFADASMPIDLSFVDTFVQLFFIVILPLFLGMLVKQWLPNQAKMIENIVKVIAVLLLVLIIVGAASKGFEQVKAYAQDIGLSIMLLNILGLMMGATLAKLANLPGRQIATLSLEVGVQNTTLAFGLAVTLLGSVLIAVPAIVYALWVYIAAVVVIVISRQLIRP